MIPRLQNIQAPAFNAVDQTMLGSDAARPVALPFVLQRLGFADARERIASDISDQPFNTRYDLRIVLAPPGNIFFRPCGEEWLNGDGRGGRFLFRLAHGLRADGRRFSGYAEGEPFPGARNTRPSTSALRISHCGA